MLLLNSTIVTASLKDLYSEGLRNNNIFSAELLLNRSKIHHLIQTYSLV